MSPNVIVSCAFDREKGGAYGAGASQERGGVFSFMSYRDPNVVNTIQKFKEAVDWVRQGDFTQVDIDEAKLRIFASVSFRFYVHVLKF